MSEIGDTPPPSPGLSDERQGEADTSGRAETELSPAPRQWVRYWARMLDIYAFALVVGVLLSFVLPFDSPFWELHDAFLTMLMLFAWVFVEPIFLSTIGTTPGKALLKVNLTTARGNRLDYADAFGRSFKVWVRGLGFGVPLVSFVTLIVAYGRLRDNGETSWDREGAFVVAHGTIGVLRTIVAALFLSSVIALMFLPEV